MKLIHSITSHTAIDNLENRNKMKNPSFSNRLTKAKLTNRTKKIEKKKRFIQVEIWNETLLPKIRKEIVGWLLNNQDILKSIQCQ